MRLSFNTGFMGPMLVLLVQVPFAAAEMTRGMGGAASIQLTDKGLTVQATDLPKSELLSRIAAVYGASLRLQGTFSARTSISFRDLSISAAVRRIVDGGHFVILHDAAAAARLAGRPVEIRVYAPRRATAVDRAGDPAHPRPADLPRTGKAPEDRSAAIDEPAIIDLGRPAIEALAARAGAADIQALGEVVERHGDDAMRYLALDLLTDIGNDAAVQAVERGLGDENPLFRSNAVATLGDIVAADAARSLGQVVFGESDPSVRLLAVESLALRQGEPVKAFLKAAAVDPDPAVREAAVGALRGFD